MTEAAAGDSGTRGGPSGEGGLRVVGRQASGLMGRQLRGPAHDAIGLVLGRIASGPPSPPMPEDEEDLLGVGESADMNDTTEGGWLTSPRLDRRSLEKRGDQTGQDGNLQRTSMCKWKQTESKKGR